MTGGTSRSRLDKSTVMVPVKQRCGPARVQPVEGSEPERPVQLNETDSFFL